MTWYEPGHVGTNGRTEVRCTDCGNRYWLTPAELEAWQSCAHCHGWVSHWPEGA